ncbi:hypothetical protein JHV666_41330 [Mycobacterium avium subsp. hominissuis]
MGDDWPVFDSNPYSGDTAPLDVLGYPVRDGSCDGRGVGGKKDFVTDRLHYPSAVGSDEVACSLLESSDETGEFAI